MYVPVGLFEGLRYILLVVWMQPAPPSLLMDNNLELAPGTHLAWLWDRTHQAVSD